MEEARGTAIRLGEKEISKAIGGVVALLETRLKQFPIYQRVTGKRP
jgi:hypothetical protein